MTLRVSAKAPVKASNKVRLATARAVPIAECGAPHRLFATLPFRRRARATRMSRGRRDATGSDAFERSGTIRRCLLNDVRIVSRRIRVDRAPPRPRATHIRSHHRLKTTSLTTNFPITQVAFGAPSKAMKASFVRPKAVRKGVVAMSASTDDIIEKMKTLTVSPRTRHRPKRAEFHRIKRMRSGF